MGLDRLGEEQEEEEGEEVVEGHGVSGAWTVPAAWREGKLRCVVVLLGPRKKAVPPF